MISIKQILYALAVEKTLHFKKASEACAVSQSALSTALSEMEKQLGFQIFERNNKQVLITTKGRQALQKAHHIKTLLDELQQYGEDDQNPLNTRMTIGIIPTICPYLLPVVLPSLQQEYPQFDMQISEEQSQILVEKVRYGDLDAAILALPYDCEGLLSFTFWQEDFYWVTHIDDELAQKQSLTHQELNPHKLMLLKEGHCLKDHALAACRLSQISDQRLSATSLNTLVQLVANGLGTTLIPQMAIPQLVANNPDIAKIPLDEPGPHRQIAFVVRPNYPGLKKIELLMSLFERQLQFSQS